jgi:hypothetical protein
MEWLTALRTCPRETEVQAEYREDEHSDKPWKRSPKSPHDDHEENALNSGDSNQAARLSVAWTALEPEVECQGDNAKTDEDEPGARRRSQRRPNEQSELSSGHESTILCCLSKSGKRTGLC